MICKRSAEFNTVMKPYSKLVTHNYERSSPSDKQRGERNHKSSIDAAMIKLLAYKSTHINQDTLIIMNYSATAAFDRMYHGYGNMFNAKEKVVCAICKCVSGKMKRSTRSVKTRLGMSNIMYKQRNDEKKMTREIQGKTNVL
jgi:hypothetical protein